MGWWCSNTYLKYIQPQVTQLATRASAKMATNGHDTLLLMGGPQQLNYIKLKPTSSAYKVPPPLPFCIVTRVSIFSSS
jgi:hypothetical protein